ncbi:MAG: tRNA pseudouridine(38-40) synthase TruA [Rickettsiales bacterium]|jgi:tRNA pseudouridine38-40 synthase|nr:tRNA pseudouridine(38-40) synthase TruA [Rickettsiales bacterium]
MRYKLILEYDGTSLIGFQKNKNGDSVQSLVEDAIFKFCGERVEVVGCGRTDAGVHAAAMPAHFDLSVARDSWFVNRESGFEVRDTIKRALNFYLSDSPVSVADCEAVPDDWHARFSCVRRNYRYVILNRDFPPTIDKNFVWWIPKKLDIDAMRGAAEKLVGNHDFSSFRASECQAKSPVKTIDEIKITNHEPRITIDFSARSFLHHQVRNIVGTLVEIGLGKPIGIESVLAARDRGAAGPTAPARGLFFMSADYA